MHQEKTSQKNGTVFSLTQAVELAEFWALVCRLVYFPEHRARDRRRAQRQLNGRIRIHREAARLLAQERRLTRNTLGIELAIFVHQKLAEQLEQLPVTGRLGDWQIDQCVWGVCRLFRKRTGNPRHKEAGEIVIKVFGDRLGEDLDAERDPAEWAQKAEARFIRLRFNRTAFIERLNKHHRRSFAAKLRGAAADDSASVELEDFAEKLKSLLIR